MLAFGADASAEDPHGEHSVTRAAFVSVARTVARLNLPTVVVQEGGYLSEELGPIVADVLGQFEQ